MTRLDPSTEPNRQPGYRRLYVQIYRLKDEIARQDSCIGYLLAEIRAAQKRIELLEAHNADTPAKLAKLAQERMEAVRRVEQCGDLSTQEYGGSTVGRHIPGDRR
jgi:septal ring factor EnvC (AmiA/AmiB activator)